jgi:hypothetical protein
MNYFLKFLKLKFFLIFLDLGNAYVWGGENFTKIGSEDYS